MRMPPHDFVPPTDFVIGNGQAVRSDHATTIDEWSTYLAAVAYPKLPTLLTGTPLWETTGRGWRSNDTTEGNNPTVTIPIVVPPFCKWLMIGVVATGRGFVRFTTSTDSTAARFFIDGGKGDTAADQVTAWCDAPGATATDTSHPMRVATAGYKIPTLQYITVQFCTIQAKGFDLEIHSMTVIPRAIPAGTDMSSFATTLSAGATAL